MTKAEIHEEIADLLKLMEINNNRLALNDATAEIDVQQMRTHVLRLYTLLDQYSFSEEAASEPELEEPTPEGPKPEPIITAKKPVRKKRKLKFKPEVKEVVKEPVKPKVEEEPVHIPEPVEEVPEVSLPVEQEIVPEVPTPEVQEVHAEIPEPTPTVEVQPEKKKKSKKIEKKAKPKTNSSGGDIYHRLKNTKLESIKKGISISKRYEIQNELFGNDATAYNQSIQTLDTAADLDAAVDFFENTLVPKHQWDIEEPLVEELRNLLDRRYM